MTKIKTRASSAPFSKVMDQPTINTTIPTLYFRYTQHWKMPEIRQKEHRYSHLEKMLLKKRESTIF